MDTKRIENIVNNFLKNGNHFLVEVDIKKGNVINVFVDGDKGISIDECVKISRNIESFFDREEEDFELRVSSPGLSRPFKLIRQYKKYINREIVVKTADERKIIGVLKSVDENKIEIEIKSGKKGRNKEVLSFRFDEINEAKPVISFN